MSHAAGTYHAGRTRSVDPPVESRELAAVLAGSTPGAAALLAETLARDPAWAAAGDGYDLTPRLRVGLVRTFVSSPLGRSRPPAEARGLDALSGPARAAVALRDVDHLTTGEIATILDRPAAGVGGDLSVSPPGTHATELAALRALAPTPADVIAQHHSVVRALRSRRRSRGLLLGVAAILIAAAGALPTIVLPRLPVEVRTPGTWRYSHEVVLADGWRLQARSIDPALETTSLFVPWYDETALCEVVVAVRGVAPEVRGEVTPTTVRGRPGERVTRPGNAVELHWTYADDAWASVECDAGAAVSEAKLREIAGAVRFRDNRQLLPFRLTSLPPDYRIQTVGETFGAAYSWGPTVQLIPPDNSYRAAMIVGPDLRETGQEMSSTTVSSCVGEPAVCITAYQFDDQVAPDRRQLRLSLAQAMDALQPAADRNDRSTWYDATELP